MTDNAMIYTDQSAKDLRLNLFEGAVDKKILSVLSTGQIELPYGKVEIGIIGASHFFNFNLPNGNTLFTEVFACTDLDETNRAFYGNLQNASCITKCFDNVSYLFTAKKCNWENGQEHFEKLLELTEVSSDNYQVALVYTFPSQKEGDFPPLTAVYCKSDPNKLDVEVKTLHAYPNEGSLVFTETQIHPK